VTKAGRVLGIFAVFGIAAAIAYWLYLYISEGSAPSFSDLWSSFSGGITSVTGLGKLNFAQIQGYASNAGFSGDDLNTACAIALAESSGNPNVTGDLTVTPGGSIGLWQINLKAHPEYTAAQLVDPQTNANAAYAIYSAAGGFTPWTTFNTGAYEAYLPASTPTVASADDSGGGNDNVQTETVADNSGSAGDSQSMIGGSDV
jgi:hypothetical protein